ncbi:hypothetical protein BDZ89DRAFT_526634 [Hymenopellis radicata]|nr:hypothetical protein BDZ89DRAFT_526634 [Hymenopellis radicata]
MPRPVQSSSMDCSRIFAPSSIVCIARMSLNLLASYGQPYIQYLRLVLIFLFSSHLSQVLSISICVIYLSFCF